MAEVESGVDISVDCRWVDMEGDCVENIEPVAAGRKPAEVAVGTATLAEDFEQYWWVAIAVSVAKSVVCMRNETGVEVAVERLRGKI